MEDKIITLMISEINKIEEANDLGLKREVRNRINYIKQLAEKYELVFKIKDQLKNNEIDEEMVETLHIKLDEIDKSLGGK